MRKDDWAAAFSIFDERGQLAAIVEAKARLGIDLSWAKDWLALRLEHERLAGPQFLLLVTPETMYLWKRRRDGYSPEPLAADARRILAPYISPRVDLVTIDRDAFDSIVGDWLRELVYGLWHPETPDELRLIVDSGLLQVIENGRVDAHAFV